jgi:DnaK suppressor protein
LREKVAPPLRGEPVKKPAVKKTSKKVAAPAARARPAAKKAGSQRPGTAKGKAVPAAKKKAVAAKEPVATKKPVAKKATAPKKAAPAKAAPPKRGASHGAAPVAKKAAAPAKAPVAGKLPAAPKPAAVGKAAAPAKPSATPAAAVGKVAVPVPTLTPGAPLAMPNGFVPRKPGRGTPKYFVAPVQAPLPPPTSRFADRFAPPRPPTRQMNKQENDTPRQAHKADPKLANAWKTKAGRDLSDDELLAMPEAEYMNEKQLEFFRMKLQALKDDLLSNAGETTEHLREDTSIVPDPADRATIEEEHALELRTRDRERKLLKKISQSLGRIESGEYGFCDETGEPIGLGRLIARPTATLSLEAQQRRELKQKMFGD